MSAAVVYPGVEPGRPSGSKVWAQSKFAWDCLPSPQLIAAQARLWRASLKEWFVALKRPGKVAGGDRGLTRCDRDLLRLLIWYAETFPEIRPSVATLAEKLAISPRQVHRSKAKLKALGAIDWDRRCEETDKPGPKGLLVVQMTNLYRLVAPPALQRIMDRLRRRPRAPVVDAGTASEAADIRRARDEHATTAVLIERQARREARASRIVHHAVDPAVNDAIDARSRVTDRH